ncbi:hypothetical protein E2C01_090031 [Portunus trituberculatus]|uniref:Uncharacterized protein n=1 Tax=Portunus trituberculatus TaxID=210409 RepID=A0A5B7JR65_PORTR|nr:hypothetical protein [Portunus trituberculatus]
MTVMIRGPDVSRPDKVTGRRAAISHSHHQLQADKCHPNGPNREIQGPGVAVVVAVVVEVCWWWWCCDGNGGAICVTLTPPTPPAGHRHLRLIVLLSSSNFSPLFPCHSGVGVSRSGSTLTRALHLAWRGLAEPLPVAGRQVFLTDAAENIM